MNVRLHSSSLSSHVAQACLARQGIAANIVEDDERPGPRPVLVLNSLGQTLLADLFPDVDWDKLGYPLQQREVLWGTDPQPRRIAETGLVLRQDQLTDGLGLATQAKKAKCAVHGDWEVNAAGNAADWIRAGDRVVVAARVKLKVWPDPPRSVMESLSDSWLHLAQTSDDDAVLQVMLAKPPADEKSAVQDALASSMLIGPAISRVIDSVLFRAAPALRLPVIDPPHLSMAGGAMRFDPISGEGSPLAIQGAILAAGVIGRGGGAGPCLHYTQRLLNSFLAHLDGCSKFYSKAFGEDPAWQDEIWQMQRLHGALSHDFHDVLERPYQYRLDGFVLNLIG